MPFSNSSLTNNARSLRQTMTKEERRLWYGFLKSLPETVNRQKVIGPYIVDFFCFQAQLVIEVDGSQHYETAGMEVDAVRDDYLRSLGLRVLRFSNLDVNRNFRAVCEEILKAIRSPDQQSEKDRLTNGLHQASKL